MTDKEAIYILKNYIECLMEDYGYYKDIIEFRDSIEYLEKSLQTKQSELEKKDRQIEELEKRLCNHDEIISRLEEDNTRKDKKIKELEADNYECNNIINDFIDGNKELMVKLGIDNANDKTLVKYYEQAYREAREREDNFYMKSHRRQIDMANARIEVRKGILSILEE